MADDERAAHNTILPKVVFDPVALPEPAATLLEMLPVSEWDLELRRGSLGPFGRQNPDPGDRYREVFSPSLKDAIRTAVQRAYAIVQECHFPQHGFNAQTFGHNVYHVGCFQLGAVCQNTPIQLTRMEESGNLARFQSGEYTLGFYKVGRTATENIWECFPTSENGANDGHPLLPGLEDAMLDDVTACRYAIVAHLGNPEDGLCALYLCIPADSAGGRIRRWSYVEELCLDEAPSVATVDLSRNHSGEGHAAPEEVPEGDVVVSPKELADEPEESSQVY
ncbi:MAG: hypothetical protein IPK80_27735 [Nannocystis sp.]|nr:hypothetical protein [Nannocystis sp.]